jgi:hypothetical protein
VYAKKGKEVTRKHIRAEEPTVAGGTKKGSDAKKECMRGTQ